MTVTFFGGEPLLRFDFIKNVVRYTEKISPKTIATQFALVTNGTLISPQIASFLKEKRFILSLSIDGDEETHDKIRIQKNGSGSYGKIFNNLPLIENGLPVLARVTISNHNYNVEKTIRFINSLGFSRIVYELDHNLSAENFGNFLNFSDELFAYYIRSIRNKEYYDLRNATRILASILLKKKSKSHCNAGIGYMCVSADGLLYPCHRFIGQNDLSLGHVEELERDSLQQLIDGFNESLKQDAGERNRKCHMCPFTLLCGGSCYYHSYLKKQNFFSVIKEDCIFKQNVFKNVLKMLCDLRGTDLQNLLNFLKIVWGEEKRQI